VSFSRFSWAVLAITLGVILFGAVVRATGSGAGCGEHWPDCNGQVVPLAPTTATAIEFTHRATSGIAMLLVLAQLVWAWRAFRAGRVRRAAAAAATFMVVEALVGAGLAVFGLVEDDASAARAIVIAVHLVNTFLLVAALALTAHFATDDRELDPGGGVGWLLAIGALALLLTGASGAITALGDTLFPHGSLAEGFAADRSPTAHFLVRLRVVHPIAATLTFVYVTMAAGLAAMMRPDRRVRRAAAALAGAMLAQMAAGLVNLALLAPIGLQLLHLFLADVAWIALVLLGANALAAERARAASASSPFTKESSRWLESAAAKDR
jgi:heme A synthase